uniref:EF-hand domain-containing protein n=1 Tax=Lotharella globosa TaxID=91324 RepID=A0A6V3LNL2_9EUKA
MSVCTACGSTLGPGEGFCTDCGRRVGQSHASTVAIPAGAVTASTRRPRAALQAVPEGNKRRSRDSRESPTAAKPPRKKPEPRTAGSPSSDNISSARIYNEASNPKSSSSKENRPNGSNRSSRYKSQKQLSGGSNPASSVLTPLEVNNHSRPSIIRVLTNSRPSSEAVLCIDSRSKREGKGSTLDLTGRNLEQDTKNQDKKKRYKLRVRRKQMKFPELVTSGCVRLAAAIFRKFDLDKNGLISRKELEESITKVCSVSPRTAGKRASAVINEIQANSTIKNKGGEDVEFNEFLNVVAASRTGTNAPETKKLIQNAGFHYNVSDFVSRFYRPRPQEKGYFQSYKCWPPPIAILLLSVLMLAVFIYYVELDNQCAGEKLGSTQLRCPEVFDNVWAYHYDSAYKGEWWRFLTYMVLHAGAAHITANLFLQTFVGVPLEMAHGPWRPLLLYILGVLAGSFAVSMFDEKVNLVGASAGAYALVGAHLANLCHYWHVMPFAWFNH